MFEWLIRWLVRCKVRWTVRMIDICDDEFEKEKRRTNELRKQNPNSGK